MSYSVELSMKKVCASSLVPESNMQHSSMKLVGSTLDWGSKGC